MAFRLIEGTPSDVKAAGLDPHGFGKVLIAVSTTAFGMGHVNTFNIQPFSLQGEKKVVRAALNYLKKVLMTYNTTAEVYCCPLF